MIGAQKSRAASTGRKPQETSKNPDSQAVSLKAPVKGWVEGQSLDLQDVMWHGENVFPTLRGVRVRGGAYKVAQAGAAVTSLFRYKTGSVGEIFAATSSAIYDISAFDPNTTPTASVSGQTGGLYSTAQIGTTGGEFLYAVNGADKAQLYDGSTWTQIDGASTPAITGVTTSDLSQVWLHKNRLWFIEDGTQTAWYLPVDSIGGAAADFSLAGVFQLGGSLLFGATWSQDSGSGMDDRQVFVSDLGEVAVYQGTDPASASAWSLVGVYRMGKPLGKNAHVKAGGDLLVATDLGLVPLSAVVSKDPAALEMTAVSDPIRESWQYQSTRYTQSSPWNMTKWSAEGMLFVGFPTGRGQSFVANLNSGAWAQFTGWDVQCAVVFNDIMYFGSADGNIYQAERGGQDNGASYVAKIAYAPQDFGNGAVFKRVGALQAIFAASSEFNPQLSASSDYSINFPSPPSAAADPVVATSTWDAGKWDEAIWDGDNPSFSSVPIVSTGWVAVGRTGGTISPQVQITISSEATPNIELLRVDALLSSGSAVV